MQRVEAPALSAVVGTTCAGVAAPAAAWPPGLAGLKLQNEVLRRLHELDAVLPVRAGTVFRSADDLHKTVARYDSRITKRLDLVAGKVELGLELCTVCDPRTDQECGPGRQYLRRLGGAPLHPGPVEAFCLDLHRRLAEISTDSVKLTCLRPRSIFRAGYLVPKDGVDRFRDLVTEEAKEINDLELMITGPWPPYSFACLEVGRE